MNLRPLVPQTGAHVMHLQPRTHRSKRLPIGPEHRTSGSNFLQISAPINFPDINLIDNSAAWVKLRATLLPINGQVKLTRQELIFRQKPYQPRNIIAFGTIYLESRHREFPSKGKRRANTCRRSVGYGEHAWRQLLGRRAKSRRAREPARSTRSELSPKMPPKKWMPLQPARSCGLHSHPTRASRTLDSCFHRIPLCSEVA